MTRTMMKTMTTTAALSLLASFSLSTLAQAQEEPARSYIYATYFNCDVTKQERADEIVQQLNQPFWEAAVSDGTVAGWGWLVHHTGGKWRRAMYFRAPSIEALFAAQEKVGDQIDAKNKKMSTEFGAICNSHDDYIWSPVAGKGSEQARGNASFSVYYECDITREEEADALVKLVFAPILDKLVADGKLISWGWNEHIVGAQYRRLSTITAGDTNALIQARTAIVEAAQDNPLGRTFDGICGPHADYIWDIKAEKVK